MSKPGRNDPCHCGSGRKYKKCHWMSDQQSHLAIHAGEFESPAPLNTHENIPRSWERRPDCDPLKQIPELLDMLSKRGSASDRKLAARLRQELGSILESERRHEEIQAAAVELESYKAEFQGLMEDQQRVAEMGAALFAEDRFAALRFRPDEVKRAFDHVGRPAMFMPDDGSVEKLRAAILHLADPERRRELSRGLLLTLPELVRAGRYMEAHLVQCMAAATGENQEESNLFLFHMFAHGYEALDAEKRAAQEDWLRQMGFDPDALRGMNLDELDQLVRARADDPAGNAAFEAFFNQHPDLREESIADMEAMYRHCTDLLKREDTHGLLLSDEEVEPWVTLLNERLAQSGRTCETTNGQIPSELAEKLCQEVMVPFLREMAAAVFDADRIARLVSDLRAYRNQRFDAGEPEISKLVTGAISYVEREDSPGENSFLVALCWNSLTAQIEAIQSRSD